MSEERTQEFGDEGFSGGEEVREADEELFEAENEVREGEEFVAENEFVEEEKESYSVENDAETTSASSSNKRIKSMATDRLSALPDSILIHILSFLKMNEAASTAALSKRWQFLWTDLPKLKFRERSNLTAKLRKFVTRVHRSLVLRSGNYLETFEVNFTYDKCFASDVNVWVEFAVQNKVKEFVLLLLPCEDLYTLPQMLYSNSSLTRLILRGCIMAPRRTIEWRCLTRLVLEEVELSQHVIAKILSDCPVLSSLFLSQCWGFNCLEANSQCLRELTIVDCEDGKSGPLLEISAPYIQSFIIWHYPKRRRLQLTNIPSVAKAAIAFNGSDWDASSEEVMSNTKQLFDSLKHVNELMLGNMCIEVLSVLAAEGWQLPQSRREHLNIFGSRDERIMPGIVGLLESSPNLETLEIQGYDPEGASVTWGPDARGDLDCDLLHLKTVNITDFADTNLAGEPMLTLAQILLNRASVLEKMVIDVEETAFSSKRALEMAQTLLSYPRSSRKAAVLFR